MSSQWRSQCTNSKRYPTSSLTIGTLLCDDSRCAWAGGRKKACCNEEERLNLQNEVEPQLGVVTAPSIIALRCDEKRPSATHRHKKHAENQSATLQITDDRWCDGQWEYRVRRSGTTRTRPDDATEAWEGEQTLSQCRHLLYEFLCATYVGSNVSKHFPQHGFFEGKVTRVLKKTHWFEVQYSDGDKEDVDREHLEEILLDVSHRVSQHNTRQPHMKALPSGEKKPSKKPRAKEANGMTVAQIKEDRWHDGHWEYRVQQSFDAKEAWESAEMLSQDQLHQFLCATFLGRIVSKDFPQYGHFMGKVTRVFPKTHWFEVEYSDGDKEDIDREHLEEILVEIPLEW